MTVVDRALITGPGPVRVLLVGTSGTAIALARDLAAEGLEVTTTAEAEQGASHLRGPGADVVLLDLTLPETDAPEACRHLVAATTVPIVILTPAGGGYGHDKRSPLGVTDEIVLPCGPKDIASRLRRTAGADQRVLAGRTRQAGRQLARLWVDPAGRRASLDGRTLELTRIEFDLLDVLSSRPGTVFSRVDLLEKVWGPSWYGDTHVVDVHVSNLRRKLGERNGRGRPRLIETVRGIGFRLTDA